MNALRILAILSACVAIVWLLALAALSAAAHQSASGRQYPEACCSNQDCAMVPMKSVTVTDYGFYLKLLPGEHPMAPEGGEWHIQRSAAKPSPDGEYHACISERAGVLFCLFVPPMGV